VKVSIADIFDLDTAAGLFNQYRVFYGNHQIRGGLGVERQDLLARQ